MMKVAVLASYNFISYCFLYPLLAARRQLATKGCDVDFFAKPDARLFDADTVLIDSRCFTPYWNGRRQEGLDKLARLRKRVRRLIWLDVTDSSGTTQFQVLPFVDKYLKKQLLRDKRLYLRTFYNGRVYTDYYLRQFSLPAGAVDAFEPAKEEDLSKLAVSWNLGLAPTVCLRRRAGLLSRLPWTLKKRFRYGYRQPAGKAEALTNDLFFRGSDDYSDLSTAFQRRQIKKRLERLGVPTGPLPYGLYLRELSSSKICISPFGSGEICFRDFEIMAAGRLLLKPDMSHLETWPPFYEENVSFVPFKWDFSDFEARIESLLEGAAERERIAAEGHRRYLEFFAVAGTGEFADRFMELMR